MEVAWYENDGLGQFRPKQVITTTANGVRDVYAADLDGDGDLDVLLTSWGPDDDEWYMYGQIAWYPNDGSGRFGSGQVISDLNAMIEACVVDLDSDGDLDVISASSLGEYNVLPKSPYDKTVWYANDGSGRFGPEQVISPADGLITSVHAADLNDDGNLDVLSASLNRDELAWYENDGFGQFGSLQTITTAADYIAAVDLADLDGDGDLDVLSTSLNDAKIAWYENDELNHFDSHRTIATTPADSVYAADLDGDGDKDVLSVSSEDANIVWHENDGLGQFGPQQVVTTEANYARDVYPADLDDDGDLDVL